MDHFWKNIPSEWFDFQQVYSLAVQRTTSPAVFVELGTWLGQSAGYMAVEIANSGKEIKFHCVDVWEDIGSFTCLGHPEIDAWIRDTDVYDVFRQFMQRGGVWDRIITHRTRTVEAAALFADASVDFCFVDADHEYESVMADIAAWLPKVKPGGLFAGHDFSDCHRGVQRAVRETFGKDFTVQGYSWLHFVPEVSGKQA